MWMRRIEVDERDGGGLREIRGREFVKDSREEIRVSALEGQQAVNGGYVPCALSMGTAKLTSLSELSGVDY